MRLVSCIVAVSVLSGCASMSPAEKAAWVGTIADAGTTYAGIQSGLTEMNPLYGHSNVALKALAIGTLFNLGLRYLMRDYSWDQQRHAWAVVSSFRFAAAGWNTYKTLTFSPAGVP